ncbi:MED7 protein-domain-containing protein [Macrophomina phaseolina]|uniref:Mediator of RNA polymerase II transcription subunit 7 n=1 Tax=Macrophomina phaseolina TaxID=35725 RepID=A0ABQ8FUJ9_9PEZI|nr:MED7 protein-domain-containing protein [Macrophomina phaseolina]
MADDNPDNLLSATFPAPPPFWKHFTPENRARLKELQDAARPPSDQNDARQPQQAPRLADLPPELRYLQPPEPPANGKYRSFGDHYDIHTPLRSLQEMQIEQLYPSAPSSPSAAQHQSQWTLDRAAHIKSMTQSLLLNYLELLGALAIDPPSWQRKYEDMQTLLFNAHHLINEYRPHQARASLIAMMEEEVRRRREEVEGVRRMGERIDEVLAGLGREGGELVGKEEEAEDAGAEAGVWREGGEEKRRRLQGAVMRALDEELLGE